MNSLRFNSGTLNGSRVVSALAFIACTATADVSANATYVHSSVATVVAGASFTASSIRNQFGSSSDFIGNAYFLVTPTHTHRVSSGVSGSADLVGYSLRYIGATADFVGMATATFVPANAFGTCSFVSTAEFNAEATKVQFGKGSSIGEGFVTLTEPVVIRYVLGNVLGSGSLYGETRINGVQEAYANPAALSSVDISDEGLVIKQVGALITGQAFVSSAETYTYSTKSNVVVTSEVTADAVLITYISGHAVGTASIVADITYFSVSDISLIGSANVANTSVAIKHAATGQAITNTASILASATRTINASTSPVSGSASIAAKGTYVYYSGWDAIGSALIGASPSIAYAAECTITASTGISADPIVPVPYHAYADFTGSTNLNVLAAILRSAAANFTGSGYLSPIGYENLMSPVSADRTFVRPKRVREFSRPAGNKTFKR